MPSRQPFENRYCNPCQSTQRHEVKDTAYACLRCGVVKFPVRRVAPRRGYASAQACMNAVLAQ